MIGLLIEEADKVSKDAVACSCNVELSDCRKPMIGSRAPASIILILFLHKQQTRNMTDAVIMQ